MAVSVQDPEIPRLGRGCGCHARAENGPDKTDRTSPGVVLSVPVGGVFRKFLSAGDDQDREGPGDIGVADDGGLAWVKGGTFLLPAERREMGEQRIWHQFGSAPPGPECCMQKSPASVLNRG
jgi:hypothetical protein